jgi:lipopolysaccharide biosynthesis glycosyltransferase
MFSLPLQVATSTDERYLPYTAAMVRSLADHRDPGTDVELTVMTAGVSKEYRARLESVADGLTLRWVVIDVDSYDRWGGKVHPATLTPHYFRCLLPHVFPPTVERVLYLDADTLVLDDLRPLWEWGLRGNPVAAAGDLMSVVADAIDHWQEIGLDPEAPYFNSGVMVIDLALWRKEDIGGQVLRRCQADSHRLLIRGRWNQHDQYGFNVVLQHRWTRLAARWNHFPERQSDCPGIVHFLGDSKPGAALTRPEFTWLFAKTIDATPWAGWRPNQWAALASKEPSVAAGLGVTESGDDARRGDRESSHHAGRTAMESSDDTGPGIRAS